MNEIINCADMISQVFSNIHLSDLENGNKICNSWKKVVSGIKNSRNPHYGERLAAHSNVVDLKNGILLVETDHPGWSQVLQMNSKFIMRGLKMYAPDLKIETIIYRLKGTDVNPFVNYEEAYEKAREKMNIQEEEDEKKAQEFYKDNQDKTQKKVEIPEELQAKLDSLKNSVLTNSKK